MLLKRGSAPAYAGADLFSCGLCSLFLPRHLHLLTDDIKKGWKRGNDDDAEHDGNEISVNARDDTAQYIPEDGEAYGPQESTDDIIEKKRAIRHVPHTRKDRRECAHYRQEAREHERLAAVAIVKRLRARNILFAEKKRIFFGEDARANFAAECVAEGIAKNRRRKAPTCQQDDIAVSLGREKASGKQQRIAGEKEPDKETRLRKDNYEKPRITASVDERRRFKHGCT